jgi:hypothetical protein
MLRRREDKGGPKTSYYSPSPNLVTGCREGVEAGKKV